MKFLFKNIKQNKKTKKARTYSCEFNFLFLHLNDDGLPVRARDRDLILLMLPGELLKLHQ